MSYRPPYGTQPPGNYPVQGAGGMTNMQGQFTMGVPQQQQQPQSFQMMQQQQSPQQSQSQGQTAGIAAQMYASQPGGGVYPTSGYGQMLMQRVPYMGQGGVVQSGMMARGQAGMVPGIASNMQLQQNMTPEQQKKYLEKQKKLLEEQKKKEEQERKDRYREEQKRKLKEFSTGGRTSMGSKSLDMGDLLSKSLMPSHTQHHPSVVKASEMHYQQEGMLGQTVGFMSQGHPLGVASMHGVVNHPSVQSSVTHSQSMDDGFSGFQKAAPSITAGNTEGDDFGDFLQAPSNSEGRAQPVPADGDDDGFGDFLGGPGVPQSEPNPPQHDGDKKQTEMEKSDPKTDRQTDGASPKGSSLENMMMQSTDLSESQKQRKRFNQKPSLKEVKTTPKSVSTFVTSIKSRSWKQETEDLSALFTLPTAAQGGQQTPMPAVQGEIRHPGEVGQVDPMQPVALPAFQQQQNPGQLPAWLQSEVSLPTVYHQVLEASTQDGAIQTNLLYPIFLLSGLDRPMLGHIWSLVNHTLPGQLVAQELYMALALIAHAQRGHEISITALCSLSEAPIPQLTPANQQPQGQSTQGQSLQGQLSQGQSQPTPLQQPGMSALEGTVQPVDDDDDFAEFQEAPKTTSVVTNPAVPGVLPSISKFTESSNKGGKKTSTATVSSLVIPSSSSTSTKNSSSPAYMQDHTPTDGEDDESFDDFKSAPSDSGPAESELDPSPVPPLPGPGLKSGPTGQMKPPPGASHIPVLVPPKGMSTRTFAAIPPPPHETRSGSSAVRPFGSEEQLRIGNDDFGEFGDFKAAGAPSNSAFGQKKKDDWGSFAGKQFKHSASESNLQGMNKQDDPYAALRDIGSSLFDSESVTVNQPTAKGEDEEFADFQQAGALPSQAGDNTSINVPGNQGSLIDSLSSGNPGFAAFSPPKEGSDWAQAAKQNKDVKPSSPQEEEFEGFFSSRTNESNQDVKNLADEASYDKYSSLAGLHSFISDKDDEVEDSFFGDFQTSSKQPQTSSSMSASGSSSKVSTTAAPQSSGPTLFRLTPPPMTSSPPTSEDAPGDDRFSALRDLSAVDPFDDVSTTPGMDGTGADYYDTQFNTIDPVKVSPKAGLDLGDLNSDEPSNTPPRKLELTLDTPSTASKTFPIGSINELDLKNYDLNLTVDSKGTADNNRQRGDSFGDFTSATTSEQALSSKDDSTIPSSGHPPPAPVQSETFFGDRYSQVVGDSSDEGRHASEWEKCLTKCHEVMSKAHSIFNNISSSSVCSEVIGSASGVDYLTGVIEVYRVACRITTSIQGLGIDSDVLGTLEKEINTIWHNLSAFLQLSSLKPTEGSFVFKTAMLRPEPSNTPQACGVCLLNVDSRSKAFDRLEDSHKLSYGGRQYHATCANLWVNMVDSILPALPLNTLL